MSVIDIFGIEIETDFMDADVLETYLSENEKVLKDINDQSLYQGKTVPDQIREQCRIINGFFDRFFGDGTSERLFRGKNNLRDRMEAFAIVTKAAQESDSELKSIPDKYSVNRAERRTRDKQNFQNFQNNHNGSHGNRGKHR